MFQARSEINYEQGRREEGAGGGLLAPGPKQVGILKLNKALSGSGLVQGINCCI